jgi:hypothetical protein
MDLAMSPNRRFPKRFHMLDALLPLGVAEALLAREVPDAVRQFEFPPGNQGSSRGGASLRPPSTTC